MPRRRNGNVQSRRWCFTVNNYSNQEEKELQGLVADGSATYVVYGREVGQSGTPHLQGYIELPRKKRLNGVRRLPGLSRAHVEVSRGTQHEAVNYCKKDGNVYEEGAAMDDLGGSRARIAAVKKDVEAGRTELDLYERHFATMLQYGRGIRRYMQLLKPERRWKTIVIVIFGGTGVGKTRFVHEQAGDRELYCWNGNEKFFCGYTGQELVLFDDYQGEVPFRKFLRLTDRYPMSVEIKGGHVAWLPKKIYITSNVHPDLWYNNVDIAPLQRRIDVLIDADAWPVDLW